MWLADNYDLLRPPVTREPEATSLYSRARHYRSIARWRGGMHGSVRAARIR